MAVAVMGLDFEDWQTFQYLLNKANKKQLAEMQDRINICVLWVNETTIKGKTIKY